MFHIVNFSPLVTYFKPSPVVLSMNCYSFAKIWSIFLLYFDLLDRSKNFTVFKTLTHELKQSQILNMLNLHKFGFQNLTPNFMQVLFFCSTRGICLHRYLFCLMLPRPDCYTNDISMIKKNSS